jgi:hypothetical protein
MEMLQIPAMKKKDWQGYTRLFAAMLPDWNKEGVSFRGLVVKGGATVDGAWKDGRFRVTIHPGWEDFIEINVSADANVIRASGQKAGPEAFPRNKKVRFDFQGDTPIILKNHVKQ